MQDAQSHLQAEEQRGVERAAREKSKRGPAQQLATTLISLRNWQIGKPQLSIGQRNVHIARTAHCDHLPDKRILSSCTQHVAIIRPASLSVTSHRACAGDRKPAVDEDGLVHWPVMFVYPETMQTDAVEDFVEADSLQQHLDVMFSPDAPPLDWDDEHEYTRDKLELYYLSHAAKPLPLEQLTEVSLHVRDSMLAREFQPFMLLPSASCRV